MRLRASIVLCFFCVGCAAGPEMTPEPGELPCIPRETRCAGTRAMSVCSSDGLSREISPCADGQACLSTLPGATCHPVDTPTATESYEATMSLVIGELPACTAFLVNDSTVLTNEHCCRGGACEGAQIIARYRSSLLEVEEEHTFGVREVVALAPELDVAVLAVDGDPGSRLRPVTLARGRRFEDHGVYVVGHPRGRPLESSMGLLFAYRENIEFLYASGPRLKERQLLYWAVAYPGSSGSPIFSIELNALVGIHHSGGLEPEDLGLDEEQTQGFTQLLAGTDSEAIAQLLEAHQIPFESVGAP